MKKLPIVIAVIVVALIVVGAIFLLPNSKDNITTDFGSISSAQDLSDLIDKVYEGIEIELPMLETRIIDMTDDVTVQSVTGIESAQDFEYIVASEPMMSAQAYSFVLAKVKSGVNADKIAETMKDNIDSRKWICVSAEKVYTTSSGDIVCLVMSSKEMAQPIYEKFKSIVGQVGQEYEKTEEVQELPPDMY